MKIFSILSECLERVIIKIGSALDPEYEIDDPFENMIGYYKKDKDWVYTAIMKEDENKTA